MKFSLIIPAYNEERYIARCLKSVIENAEGLDEVIVIDNNSTDNTGNLARSFPGVRVIKEEKKGPSHARQRGMLEASGDVLVYLDADTYISKQWFAILKNNFESNRSICLSGPCQYYDISKTQQIAVKIYWYIGYIFYLIIGYMIVGGNFAIKKEALEKIGGFNTDIAFYGDDTDLARRVKSVGKIKFNLSFIIYTSGRRFAGQGLAKTAWLYVINFLSEIVLHRPATKDYQDLR